MRKSAWVATLSVASMLTVGGLGLGGCGDVTPAGTGTAGSSAQAGTGGGSAGRAGTSGGAGTTGSAGTSGGGAGTGVVSTGGRGGTGTAGTSGGNAGTGVVSTGGRGGTGTAGTSGGNAGTGVSAGGRGGTGTAGTSGGNAGTGVSAGGRGGTGTAGTVGRGGSTGLGGSIATGGRGGGGVATGGTGGVACPRGSCPPLLISDLEAIDDSTAPGFDAPGFRCKSLTICPNSSGCIYYSNDMFGSLQSAEDFYTDGVELMPPAPVKLSINVGAASQCNNPPITFVGTEYISLSFDGGKKLAVYLPMFMNVSLTLYVASDGSTFYDATLQMPARLRP